MQAQGIGLALLLLEIVHTGIVKQDWLFEGLLVLCGLGHLDD